MATAMAAGKTQKEAHGIAGFTGKAKQSAFKVAARPDFQARVQEIIEARQNKEIQSNERAIEKAAVTKEYVVTRLKYIAEFGIRGRPLLDADGNDTGRYVVKPDLRSAGGALRTLAQMGGWLIQKHEIGAPGDFSRLSDAELDAKFTEMGEALGLSDKELKLVTGRRVA